MYRLLALSAALASILAPAPALAGHVGQVAVGPEQTTDGLTQVDDVDQIALAVNVRPHLGVPPAGAVSEVDAGLDQVLHLDDGHALPSCPRRDHG